MKWKGIFPDAKLIMGYEGPAPLGDKPAGQTYLEDILINEKQITGAANDRIMEAKLTSSVRGLQIVNSAVYIESNQCNQDGTKKDYYFNNGIKSGTKLKSFEISACDQAREDYDKYYTLYEKYQNGEVDTPKDTSSGPLRDTYTFFRQNEQCFKTGEGYYGPTADQVLYLLFFDSVKRNFARAYKDEIKDEGTAISALSTDSLEKNLRDQIEAAKKLQTQNEFDLTNYSADPENFKKKLAADTEVVNDQVTLLEKEPAIKNYQAWISDPEHHGSPSFAEQKTVQVYQKGTRDAFLLAYKKEKIDSGRFVQGTTDEIQQSKQWIADGDLRISKAKQEFSAAKANVWIPTLENIQGKTRQEILENIHALNLISISAKGAPGSQKAADLSYQMSMMLENLQGIPFEWHEDSESPVKPAVLHAPEIVGSEYSGFGGRF